MQRFFASRENFSGDQVVIQGSDAAHIHTVLRLKGGDHIHVLDGRGKRYRVCLIDVKRKSITGRIVSHETIDTESPVAITLGQPLIKGNKFDTILRKAVELGVRGIVPLQTERCVVRSLRTGPAEKIKRWRKIAVEAAKQCGRTVVPEVEKSIQSVETFCHNNSGCDLKLVFWEDEETRRLRDFISETPVSSLAFLTGPEGGLTVQEVETARRFGFHSVTLGPRKLRAETAPVAALAILQNLWGDL